MKFGTPNLRQDSELSSVVGKNPSQAFYNT